MKITYQILLQVYIDRFILKHPRLELFCTFSTFIKNANDSLELDKVHDYYILTN